MASSGEEQNTEAEASQQSGLTRSEGSKRNQTSEAEEAPPVTGESAPPVEPKPEVASLQRCRSLRSNSKGKRITKPEAEEEKESSQIVPAAEAKAEGSVQRSGSSKPKRSKRSKKSQEEEASQSQFVGESVSDDEAEVEDSTEPIRSPSSRRVKRIKTSEDDESSRFIGEPIPAAEAKANWPQRFNKVKKSGEGDSMLALSHYKKVELEGITYSLYEDVYVQGEENKPNYIAKIVELFEGSDNKHYFTAQWYYRHVDTVIGERVHQELKDLFDDKRVFYSDITDENPVDCIVSKIKIIQVSPLIPASDVPQCDFYCDMGHSLSYSTISNLPEGFLDPSRKVHESSLASSRDSSSTLSGETSCSGKTSEMKSEVENCTSFQKDKKHAMKLLDLYAGCGGMSTGLCFGATIAGVNLVTRWAVDMNEHACESLKFNHPETEVRKESAEDFLMLLMKWNDLCKRYLSENKISETPSGEANSEVDEIEDESEDLAEDEFEVGKIIGIYFGSLDKTNKKGLYFKVQWKGYDSNYDTWEPSDNLSDCPDKIKEFVVEGHKANILPLPGDADVVCGGPPCQGVSGFNRFRDSINPLKDEKNSQLIVFMDIVDYLKPKYVLMENVIDILKFVDGYLGRYALGRLIAMKYQTRLGLMVAGSYGLPQFRMRAFFWGACPTQKLPQFPLPTHETITSGNCPSNFRDNLVAKPDSHILKARLTLQDALSDLPSIANDESRDEMSYEKPAQTEFQKQIRLLKNDLFCLTSNDKKVLHEALLFDHRPLKLNEDDYARVCQIPKKQGANFRDLPGVMVGDDGKVYFDPSMERVFLPSDSPLVPDYAMSFMEGKSTKPFGRLWWDEIVTTVVTRAEPHNQRILHPVQDRVLSIRENARIQGFPDYYKLSGPVKQRYIQVGNAVAVPVARALGYSLGMAMQGVDTVEPVVSLPPDFPNCTGSP